MNLKRLESWVVLGEESQFSRASAILEEYSRMPVRKFSNIHTEKAAGYIRLPQATRMESIALWIQGKALLEYFRNGVNPFRSFSRAAGYYYWANCINYTRMEGGPVLLRAASRGVFCIGAIGDQPRARIAASNLLSMFTQGKTENFRSRVGLFCVALADQWLRETPELNLLNMDSAKPNDPTGLFAAYDSLINLLRTDAPELVGKALLRACECHMNETGEADDDYSPDFSLPHDELFAFELSFYVQLRRWLGLTTPLPEHPLFAYPPNFFSMSTDSTTDNQLALVLERCFAASNEGKSLSHFEQPTTA